MEEIKYIGKCLFIKEEKEKILCVGDLHLGYEEVLNKTGVLISREMFKEMINYFEKVFNKTGKVDKIILLGDVKHVFGDIMKQEWEDVLSLIRYLGKKLNEKGEIIIVKGNHDKILEPILRNKERVILKDYYIFRDICFMHGDKDFFENHEKKIKYWILGHGHPAVKISEPRGVKIEKYKCFLTGEYKKATIKKVIIVPSFFFYIEGSDPRENDLGMAWEFNYDKFIVNVVSGKGLEVLNFGILKKL